MEGRTQAVTMDWHAVELRSVKFASGVRGSLLALVVLTLLLVPRWSATLLDPEETRYAEIPREMLHQQQWLIPIYDGQPYLDKPPLLYWLVMVCYQFGGINVTAARLVPNLVALLIVGLTYLWGRQEKGHTAGLVAASILVLMPIFVHYGPMLTMNGLLALSVLAALMAGHRALRSESFSFAWWGISALATGLGLLAKGPVALALIAGPLFVFPWLSRDLSKPGMKAGIFYGLVAGAVALPWYCMVFYNVPEFGNYFFWRHHIERFMTPFDHSEPVWYYFPLILAGMLPWTLIVISLVLSALKTWRVGRIAWGNGFFFASALWMLIFFSASGSKRLMYLVPIYPLLALGVAGYVVEQFSNKKRICWLNAFAWKGLAGATALGLLIWTWINVPRYHEHFSVDEVVNVANQDDFLRGQSLFCYPHPFSGVSFLLNRDDIQSFGADQLAQLHQEMEKHSESVVFLKPSIATGFCEALPSVLDYAVLSQNTRVMAIAVRHKGRSSGQ